MYEGAPDYPDKDIWWELCERYGVTKFYTAPTAIRACMKWGAEYAERHDLSKLRLLGTVGEPVRHPEAVEGFRLPRDQAAEQRVENAGGDRRGEGGFE